VESLTGLDAAFLSFETANAPLHVGAVIVFDPPPGKQLLFSESARFGFVRRLIEQRIHLVPPFRRRAVEVPFGLGQPVWIEDPELDLDAHVKRARLPSPGGPAELTDFVADVLARPLDRSRPLWEMVITEGLEGGRSALVVKLHHAILDGVSAASLLGTFLDLGARPREVDPPEVIWQPERLPTAASLVKRAVGAAVHDPGLVMGTVNRSLRVVTELAENRRRLVSGGSAPPPAPFKAPRTSLNGSVSTRRSFGMASMSLAEVKLAGHAFGATINEVVLSTVGGALRQLLEARGETLDSALVAMVPVSTRERSKGTPAIADGPTLGNRVSAMLVSLATTIDDPVERLMAVSESSRGAKARTEVLGGRILDDWAQLIIPAVSTRAAKLLSNLRVFDRIAPVFNVTISNVPGPQFDLWFGGCRIDALYPIGPIVEGVGLNITALSYMGGLHVGMLGCRRLVPDMDSMAALLQSNLDQLLSAVPVTTGAAS
jgi:diacylglycerol O-acyltransferase / wax synthase